MPQHGSYPICGPWQTSQFQKIMGRSFSANHTESGCLPDCRSVKYTYTLSQVRNNQFFTPVLYTNRAPNPLIAKLETLLSNSNLYHHSPDLDRY